MRTSCREMFVRLLIFVLIPVSAYSQNRANWKVEVVDKGLSQGPAAFSSLVVDGDGTFHLAYANRAGGELRYSFRSKDAQRWDTVTVDEKGGAFNSLAIDARGWPHLVYNSSSSPGLHYAEWDGKKWQKLVIDPANTSNQTSLRLDAQGHPRISYYREEYSNNRSARNLKYAYFDGVNWYIQTVDHRNGTGKWNAIALDHAGRPYISYSIASPANIGLAYQGDSGWEHALVVSQNSANKGHSYGASSLVLDGHDVPHLAYIDTSARTVNYTWREGSTWKTETVDYLVSAGADSDRLTLKMDTSGRPHMVYFDSGRGVLRYASRDDKGWSTETIDDDEAGDFASLWLDAEGQPYVSYSAVVDKQLRIAHRSADSKGEQSISEIGSASR